MSEASTANPNSDDALDPIVPDVEGSNGASQGEAATDDLEELRRLLLAPEHTRLEVLETTPFKAEEVSRLLPEAIALQSQESDRLAQVLAPTIEESVRVSIQRDPKSIADALFPIMGPAIRKSIREALRSMMETVNRAVEHSFSPRSLKWRLEAWRTGQSFSEVVLLHTLQYRVEQVFLVDPGSGLPLQHVVAEAVEAQDSSLVSSMMTAINEAVEGFTQDSFGTDADDRLGTMQVGGLTVWFEEGPEALLAVVFRGVPSYELRTSMEDVLETIHWQFKDALEAFDGDDEPLAGTKPLLKSLLLAQYEETKQKQTASPIFWGVVAVMVVAALGYWIFTSVRAQNRWDDYLTRLDAEPGLVVTNSGRAGGAWFVHGLRDPLARDPAQVLAETPLSSGDVREQWATYQTLDSAFVLQRAIQLLDPPSSVALQFSGGTLAATGKASGIWIHETRQRALFVAGVSSYDDSALEDEIQALVTVMEGQALRFVGGRATLTTGQETALDSLIAYVQRFQTTALASGQQVQLQVHGHVSTEGTPVRNRFLSQQRADAVRTVLIERGMAPEMVEAIGTGRPRYEGEEQSEEERAANRSVSFRVVVN